MITLNNKKLCENCFSEISTEPCPHCGFEKNKHRQDPVALALGSVLSGRYMIGGVIGKGGFGITYLAYDLKLDARVAVKEYYPMGLALRSPGNTQVTVSSKETQKSFKTGAEKFYSEAKMVAKFNGNPNIVSVHDFFYENDTVYFIMGYLQGQTLKTYIKTKRVTEGQAVNIFDQISNALLASHGMNILHRDVSPDNIMLCDDKTIRLLDFGAARQVMAEQSQSLSVILKQGYAPLEQYQQKGKQGPWTDIYALGATIYAALTGDMLTDPMSRLEDDSEYASNKHGISEPLWKIIYKCTQLKIQDRYQNIEELKEDLSSVGIESERFLDIEEEITDFLRGEVPEGGALGSNIPNYAPAADPNATVFLGEDGGSNGSSNETVAMSPEAAAAYTGTPQPVPQQPMTGGFTGQPAPQLMPQQPVTGGFTGQPAPQPMPQQPMTGGFTGQSAPQPMPQQPVTGGFTGRPAPQPMPQQPVTGGFTGQPVPQPVPQQPMTGGFTGQQGAIPVAVPAGQQPGMRSQMGGQPGIPQPGPQPQMRQGASGPQPDRRSSGQPKAGNTGKKKRRRNEPYQYEPKYTGKKPMSPVLLVILIILGAIPFILTIKFYGEVLIEVLGDASPAYEYHAEIETYDADDPILNLECEEPEIWSV